MKQTRALDLPALLAKGVAGDARQAAEALAEQTVVPDALRIRVRAMQLDLSEALVGALDASPEVAQAARILVYPVQELTQVVREYQEFGTMDRGRTRLALLGISQTLERIAETRPQTTTEGALTWLLENTGWTQARLATALSVDERSVQRWVSRGSATGDNAARLLALYRIALPLRYSLTARGVGQWLERPLPTFDNHSPVDLLDDEQAIEELVRMAAALRG